MQAKTAYPERPRKKFGSQLVEYQLRHFDRHLVLDRHVRPPSTRILHAEQPVKIIG